MRRFGLLLGALGLAGLASACGETPQGALTARILWDAPPDGQQRQALRAAQVAEGVSRLEIRALDVDGATLAATLLDLEPVEGEQMLLREGGSWVLDGVPAGTNRSVWAKAFVGDDVPGFAGSLYLAGRIDGIEVEPGRVADAGDLVLRVVERIAPLDFEPPGQPGGVSAAALAPGEQLRVTFTAPDDDDVSGYVLAVATSSASNDPPVLERGRTYVEGETLAPGVVVDTIWPLQRAEIITIEGLQDGVPVGIFVYAYDDNGAGAAQNYSAAATALGVPQDTEAPAAPAGLTAAAIGGDMVRIAFTAPTEDAAGGGAVSAFEVRSAPQALLLEDADAFERQTPVTPPLPAAPGETVTFERSLMDLGAQPGLPFFVGVRGVDAATNPGAIATAEVVVNATVTPSLDAIAPPIGQAGREVVLTGTGFGTETGTVTLSATETATTTIELTVTRWTDTEIVAVLPVEARTGRVLVTRPDGLAAPALALTVVARFQDAVQDQEFPFEFVGTGRTDGRSVSALYREDGEFTQRDAAIERFYDTMPEGTPWAPQTMQGRSDWIAGTYDPATDRFLFVAADQDLSMTTALVTSSTVTPDPFRLAVGVTAGRPDRVAVTILGGGLPGEVPAMIAFTINGTIRTATVGDARFQPFDGFFAASSTVSDYDRVTLARRGDGALLLAHRTVTGTVAVLSVRDNPMGMDPNGFTPRPIATPPRAGPNFEVLAAPVTVGGPERFLVAYEYEVADGVFDVRLLFADALGQTTGLAPFPPGPTRRLDDLGLVIREGEVYAAILSTRFDGGAELSYTEVPLSALAAPGPAGAYPGAVLDIAPNDHVGRLGCKPYVQRACPMVWLGDDAGVLFYRR